MNNERGRPLVLLVYPKIDHEKDYVYYWTPFSLLAIAKVLIDDDLADVVIFDGNQSDDLAWERFLDAYLARALCVGVSIMTGGGQIGHALDMVGAAKRRNLTTPFVFGGPHVNVLGEQTALHPLVDAVLVGPGQNSMPTYVRALTNSARMEDVPGLIMKNEAGLLRGPVNPPRTQRLGRYPWELLRVSDYVRQDPCITPRTLNYVSSQGCVYNCRFCYELIYHRKYSALAAEDLLDDLEELCSRYDINGVKFYDADWFIDLRRAAAFAQGLLNRGINIKWAASINPNDVVKARRLQPDLLSLIARGGCSRLLMGIESGSDRVLNEIVRKDISREKIVEVANEIASNGIIGSYTFIVGFPGETPAEQAATYDLIDQLRVLSPQPETRVHLFAPYPGTPLYDVALEYGFTPPTSLDGWSSYDYYESQTPWTNADMVSRARANTFMRNPTKYVSMTQP